MRISSSRAVRSVRSQAFSSTSRSRSWYCRTNRFYLRHPSSATKICPSVTRFRCQRLFPGSTGCQPVAFGRCAECIHVTC